MPRPWDNAPWRRKVMQGVLCGVLILSVYGSWLLSRHRGTALMPTEWQNRQFGPLLLVLPAKWKIDSSRSPFSNICFARENQPYMGVTRSISVFQQHLGNPNISLPEYAAQLDSERTSGQTPEPLDFLGQHGVIYELPAERIESEQGPEMMLPTLLAIAILPNGTAISVRLTGPMTLVPADRRLLIFIAQSIKEVNAVGHGVAQTEHPKRLAPLVPGIEDAS